MSLNLRMWTQTFAFVLANHYDSDGTHIVTMKTTMIIVGTPIIPIIMTINDSNGTDNADNNGTNDNDNHNGHGNHYG